MQVLMETKLMDRTLWIADSCAMAPTTANKIWAENWKDVQDNMVVGMGNGHTENVT
jgi:hypothetical protein